MSILSIGVYRIDTDLGRVSHQSETVTLEPKVLKVFVLLLRHHRKIVSHQDILDTVWPDVVIEANTLQRCIAQLRKAFGDNAKQQKVITTHAKVGYCLIAEVVNEQEQTGTHSVATMGAWAALLVAVIVAPLIIWWYVDRPTVALALKHATPLTATDATEYRPAFSPDGLYVAFQRRTTGGKGNIWIKDLHSNAEFLLTREDADYGEHSWSANGERLAFSVSDRANRCDSINVVNVQLAQNSPHSSSLLLECHPKHISSVTWLSDGNLAFIESGDNSVQVNELIVAQGTIRPLYQQDDKFPYELSYSKTLQSLAILQHDAVWERSIALLNPGSRDFTNITIGSGSQYQHHGWSGIDWHPNSDRFLTANKHSLFEIDLRGQVTEFPISTYQTIYDPVYHPSGVKVSATLGIADFDIAELTWKEGAWDSTRKEEGVLSRTLHRSIVADGCARYQPKGSGIAFLSERSGRRQLWFDDGNKLKQISQFSDAEKIQSFVWSEDGRALMANVSGQIQLFNEAGYIESLTHAFKVLDIFQWVSDNTLLMQVSVASKPQVVLFDVNTGAIETLYEESVAWAQVGPKQALYISDRSGHIFDIIKGKPSVPSGLEKIETAGPFFVKRGMIFYADRSGAISQVNTHSGEVKALSRPSYAVKKIDDVDTRHQRLMYVNYVAGRKEIVMLH